MNICEKAVSVSTRFEECSSNLKREYLIKNIDMWMICADDKIEEAKVGLVKLFENYDMHTSDIDPVRTINDMEDIVSDLETGKMPSKKLPLDIHIIEYSKFSSLLDEIPFSLLNAMDMTTVPYLPIHPISLRKTWQYDDVAYNFAFDYLFSLTPFSWEDDLNNKLMKSRFELRSLFSEDDLIEIFDLVASDAVKRRFETKTVKKCYGRRLKLWEEK